MAGKSTSTPTMTGATEGGMRHASNSNTAAMVGNVRKIETMGAKNARTGAKQRAKTANATPNTSETANAANVRNNDAENAIQNAPSPSSFPTEAHVSQNDGNK